MVKSYNAWSHTFVWCFHQSSAMESPYLCFQAMTGDNICRLQPSHENTPLEVIFNFFWVLFSCEHLYKYRPRKTIGNISHGRFFRSTTVVMFLYVFWNVSACDWYRRNGLWSVTKYCIQYGLFNVELRGISATRTATDMLLPVWWCSFI